MTFDTELPGGLQEADLEMAGLEAQANREAALRRAGICTHSWIGPVELGKPARVCRHCNQVFKNEAELEESRREALI